MLFYHQHLNQQTQKSILFLSVLCISCIVSLSLFVSRETASAEMPAFSERIKEHLKTLESAHADDIARFYSERDYAPAWVQDHGINQQGHELLLEFAQAVEHGLDPHDYEGDKLHWMNRTVELFPEDDHIARTKVLEKLELALTKNFFKFVDHLTGGRVNPQRINGKWFLQDERVKIRTIVMRTLEEGLSTTLQSIAQEHDGYTQLLEALKMYRMVQERRDGWQPIKKGPLLGQGSKGIRVKMLRARLMATRDLAKEVNGASDDSQYDDNVTEAVRRFQKRHGLSVDGLVGPKTLEALNVPIEKRIQKILLNLERRRWMPRDLGSDHVVVNIPDFTLTVNLKGERRMKMRVIVGKPMSQTPIFSDKIEYVVFNPYWYVPRSIAVEEIYPKFLEDPMYLVSQNYELVNWDDQIQEIDLLTEENLKEGKVQIRQRPGPSNALGLVKFMFPNDHAVYLHDTPADYLFEESERDFSHGCIRIEDPRAFAELLLQGSIATDQMNKIFDASQRQVVDMPQPIPVFIVYFTTWVDENGVVNFRDDVYDHDTRLWQALKPVLSETVTSPKTKGQWIFGLTPDPEIHSSLILSM